MMYWRNSQPLKSRVFVPCLAILSQYGASLSSIQMFYFDLEWRSKYGCILQTLLYEHFLTVVFALMPLNYLRHIMLINLNLYKKNVSENGTKSLYIKTYTFIKVIASPIVSFNIVFAISLVSLSIDTIVIFLFSPMAQCSSGKSYGIYITHLVVNVTFGFIFLSILFMDILVNFVSYINDAKMKSYRKNVWINVLKEKIFGFFLKSDPFLFRIEHLFSMCVFFFYFLFEVFHLHILIVGKENAFYYYFSQYTSTIGRSFITYFLAFYQAILPLVITILLYIVSLISNKFKKEVESSQKLNYLEDERLFDLLYEFSVSEWSSENMFAVRIFKSLKHFEKRKEGMLHLTFIIVILMEIVHHWR
jgi:hypothetical protein